MTNWPIDKVERHLERDRELLRMIEHAQAELDNLKQVSQKFIAELNAEAADGDPNDALLSVYARQLAADEDRVGHDVSTMARRLKEHIASLEYMKEHSTPQG